MKRIAGWGVLVLFLVGIIAGASGCASDNSGHKSSKKGSYEKKREGSGSY